jgi:hypothetical protein
VQLEGNLEVQFEGVFHQRMGERCGSGLLNQETTTGRIARFLLSERKDHNPDMTPLMHNKAPNIQSRHNYSGEAQIPR